MLNKEHASRTDSGVAEFASISSHHDPLLGDSQQGQWRGQNHYRLSLLDGEPLDSSLFSRQPDSSPISLLTAQLVREGISEDGQGPRSQPIPKPAIGSKHSYRDSFMSTTVGGLSLQDSLRIETLAMSQSAAHQSFSGSPFLSGSIPLLDQFRENSRLDVGMGSGNSPPAHSLARSPPASASGFGLMRHAFTNVDSTISTPGGQDMEMGGSFQSIYHNQLHGISGSSAALDAQGSATGNGYQEANPVGAVRSIPRATDVLSRSLRSSSLVGDSRGPLTSLMSADFADHSIAHPLLSTSLASPVSAGGASTLPGRVRSNTQIPPASLLQFSSGLELSSSASHAPVRSPMSARDGHAGGGFPVQADLHSVPNDSAMAFAPGVWDSHALSPTSETSQEHSQKSHDPLAGHRPPLGGLSLASQRTSTSFTSINNMHHYPQHQQQQQQQQ
ncbi:hypothetical protein GQ54DRAFT_200224 [Martensiomyces pterosporus]|nr:hypothetical protein GQ54DRAFT_200224 [Martensiomyces pterosporus]